jgi:16S rRNA (uracil1498-N3)-methyltransferase
MKRFFSERKNIRVGSSVKLTTEQALHMRKTLRLAVGDEVLIFNGEKEFRAKIKKLTNELALVKAVELQKKVDFSIESYKEILLVQSIIKPIRFEVIIEKATELGVTKILPVNSEYSQISIDKFVKKYTRWNKIIIESAKQSERVDLPELLPPIQFDELSLYLTNYDCVYALAIKNRKESAFIEKKIKKFFELPESFSSVAILVGPEGGFSENEYEKLDCLNIEFVDINRNILRSETASIAAVSILRYLFG